METINTYKDKQQKVINILTKLRSFLIEGKQYGLEIDPNLISKIESSIKDNEQKKLSVVLIGGFSEGKTSIAAAWSEKYDKSSMKISQSESTDAIQIYDYDEDFQIIDTPGLFGFKETENKEKYKDITKKYISEADIVIYVMASDNPIKESHKEELKWLFLELGLLSRTVFVLSRFDEESDLEDEDEYREIFELKKQDVKDRLVDFEIINPSQSINIVAVSADPYGKGIEEWLKVPEEYKKLSHINELQKATTAIVNSNGGTNAVVLYKNESIVKDVLNQSLPLIETKMASILTEVGELEKMNANIILDFEKLNKRISKARINLKTFIVNHFTDLIVQAKGCGIETIEEFFDRNIGNNGIVLQTVIENEFDNQIGEINGEITKIQTDLNINISRYNSVMEIAAKNGLKTSSEFLKNGNVMINNNQILAARDMFFESIKFKPWGAVNLANKINSGLAIFGSVLGIALDVWEKYDENKRKQQVENAKEKIVDNLKQQMKEYISLLDDDSIFKFKFFPAYKNLSEQSDLIKKEVLSKQEYIKNFNNWKENADVIDVEFRKLN